MAFEIKPGESAAKSVRRMARSEIKKAIASLSGETGETQDEIVHDARKRFKRLRALIRLTRDGLGQKIADRENERFRDAGRPLSEARDAGVLVKTLDQLAEDSGNATLFGPVRVKLVSRKEDICRRVLETEDILPKVRHSIEEAHSHAMQWRVAENGWDAFANGLKWIYTNAYEGFHEALETPTDLVLHEWRKRVKDLWYILEILRPIRPEFTHELGENAHKLADYLGDDHDLAVLQQVLTDSSDGVPGDGSIELVLNAIAARRETLQADALALGRTVCAESPRVFARRMHAYWRAWRAECKAVQFASSNQTNTNESHAIADATSD